MASSHLSPTFYEFFAGGGMARAGLTEAGWKCLFANDFDAKKVKVYQDNWGAGEITLGDVRQVEVDKLPNQATLVWASFPCQDLSLAGGGAGLEGDRSGTFWPFWKKVQRLAELGRKPNFVVLENVCGTLTSHGGRDFAAICKALGQAGYRYGAVVVDAAHFVPQSRPRIFIIGVADEARIVGDTIASTPQEPWHTKGLVRAWNGLGPNLQSRWLWWSMPLPSEPRVSLESVIDFEGASLAWHTPAETQRFIEMMAPRHRKKVDQALRARARIAGTLYRRTRPSDTGGVQRAEVRFDGVAGCLRTPAGGSSRQTVVVVESGKVRSRLISAREAATLMGLKSTYKLPDRYNEAYHLLGDGVAVPAVEHIARQILNPNLNQQEERLVA